MCLGMKDRGEDAGDGVEVELAERDERCEQPETICPRLGCVSESAPEQAKPGEADGVVGHCACEVDEVEEHFARGHGCGREEGGERVEGVEQEEALAHEGEGGDGECEAAAVAGEAGGEGEGEGEGEEVDVCPEGVEKLVSAFAAVDDPCEHLQREDGPPPRGGEGARDPFLRGEVPPVQVLASVPERRRTERRNRRRARLIHPRLALRRPGVRWRRRAGERRRREMRHEVYRMGSGKSQNKQQQQVASRPVREFIPRTRSFSSCPAPMPAPTTHASSASSSTSTPVFPADQLRACIRQLLATTLRDVAYDHADPGRMKELSRGLAEKIKSQMLTLHPRGFKYIITSTLTENNNQAGRGDLVCHWEATDVAVQEMFSNDSIIFVVLAVAVRV